MQSAVPAQSNTRGKEAMLWRSYKLRPTEEQREQLAAQYDGMVKWVVNRYFNPPRDEFDDYLQEARLALLDAIKRYDPARNVVFSTYAVPTIVGSLRRYMRDHGQSIRQRKCFEAMPTYERAEKCFVSSYRRLPESFAELANYLGCSIEAVQVANQLALDQEVLSLDMKCGEFDPTRLGDLVADSESDPTLAYGRLEWRLLIDQLLSGRERQIILDRFYGQLSQTEVSQRLGISQMHVSRLEVRAINVLKRQFGIAGSTKAERAQRKKNEARSIPKLKDPRYELIDEFVVAVMNKEAELQLS